MKTKNQKREEAKVRQEKWNKFSLEEKIEFVLQRPGKSTKELEKLQKKLAIQRS